MLDVPVKASYVYEKRGKKLIFLAVCPHVLTVEDKKEKSATKMHNSL